jgi:hypothetical protein
VPLRRLPLANRGQKVFQAARASCKNPLFYKGFCAISASLRLDVEVLPDLVDARLEEPAHLTVQPILLIFGEALVDQVAGG